MFDLTSLAAAPVGVGEVTGFMLTIDEAELVHRLRTLGADLDLYPVLPNLAASGVTKTGVEVLCNLYARGRLFHDDLARLQADGLLLSNDAEIDGPQS